MDKRAPFISYILGNACECIFQCVSWFASIILFLNYCALRDTYATQGHYTVLLKRYRLFCLILEKKFGNYF